ncbi:MAG: hypothetical protein JNK72_09960 [Myxococcales bacterium]|nr:hypothetical protein [Myxococcales bacterium]
MTFWLLLLSIAAALFGCSESSRAPARPLQRFDAGLYDAGDPSDVQFLSFDIPMSDARANGQFPPDAMLGAACTAHSECADGTRCLAGHCAPNGCEMTASVCGGESFTCSMFCAPLRDPCAGVTCRANETCIAGRCVPGCIPVPCAGVVCESGQFCDPRVGRCVPLRPCAGPCPIGAQCHIDCTPRGPCDGVTCQPNEYCSAGRCLVNPCAGVQCAPTEVCDNGRCVETCGCATPCNRGAGDRCVMGQCVCTPQCDGRMCGADDGCGGRCTGPCPRADEVCDPTARQCLCMPQCGPNATCGSDDGCGGRCSTGCPMGTVCNANTRMCECVPMCMGDPTMVTCGEPMPMAMNCPGRTMDCGFGTRCPEGQTCDTAMRRCSGCMPMCPEANAVPCGQRATLCDRTMCNEVGTQCPPNQTCDNNVCVCVPGFDLTPDQVDCEQRIPNRCVGQPASTQYGTRCPNMGRCDSAAHTCIACTPHCADTARCGDSDGCGGTCPGVCDPMLQCIRDPNDMNRYACLPIACSPACTCGNVCSLGQCVPLCSTGQTLCGCGNCCRAGQFCNPNNGQCLDAPP